MKIEMEWNLYFGYALNAMFHPEGAACFTLSELKEIVKEMEKMEETDDV
jgi:hypothetical protein